MPSALDFITRPITTHSPLAKKHPSFQSTKSIVILKYDGDTSLLIPHIEFLTIQLIIGPSPENTRRVPQFLRGAIALMMMMMSVNLITQRRESEITVSISCL